MIKRQCIRTRHNFREVMEHCAPCEELGCSIECHGSGRGECSCIDPTSTQCDSIGISCPNSSRVDSKISTQVQCSSKRVHTGACVRVACGKSGDFVRAQCTVVDASVVYVSIKSFIPSQDCCWAANDQRL